MKTDYATLSRQRCAPSECDHRFGCWVIKSTRDSLGNPGTSSPRCAVCGGKVRLENWLPPHVLERVER